MEIRTITKALIDLRNLNMTNEEYEKEIGYLVWEVKRKMLNKLRELNLDIPEKTFSQLDEAVKWSYNYKGGQETNGIYKRNSNFRRLCKYSQR